MYDALVIGAGAAGLAAAGELAERGHNVALLEREASPGGILNQCIHDGFGLHHFKEELTGPEYAERFVDLVREYKNIDLYGATTAVQIEEVPGTRRVIAFSPSTGLNRFQARAVVLAMGCRERNRGNLGIPGSRPAGVFTAGLAQRFVNIEGYVPGRRVVIVGSGDIGLIMARRMKWVGSDVLAVVEIQPYPSGLTRNIVQCLNDFEIPLYLSHIVSKIRGERRVEAVELTPLREGRADYSKTFVIECDTVLLSVGLIPDNELSKKFNIAMNQETGGPHVDAALMTSREGVFACGNVLHVHDLADWTSEEAIRCASFASDFIRDAPQLEQISVMSGANVRYVLPEKCLSGRPNQFYLRSLFVKNNATLEVTMGDELIYSKRIRHVQPSEMIGFLLETPPDQNIGSTNPPLVVNLR